MKQILLIDMDNVLVDFQSGIDKLPPEVVEEYGDDLDDVPGIFALMDPMPGAIEAYRELAERFDTYILSTAPWKNPSAWSDKVEWVKNHLGDAAYKRLTLTHHKDLVKGDFLIDDRLKHGVDRFPGKHIHFGTEEFPDWEAVLRYLRGKGSVPAVPGEVVAGVDGCRAGWICVWASVPTSTLEFAVFASFREFIEAGPSALVFTVDIPIGLADTGPRLPDTEARSRLGKRGSSVFPAPIRDCLAAETYQGACRIAREVDGARKGISKQTYAILEKIREVDQALQEDTDLQTRIFEVHPEICFWAMNGTPMEYSKKKSAGREERLRVLPDSFKEAYSRARDRYLRKDVADDDILDALAALWTAERIATDRSKSLPSEPELDSTGLPMRIVY